MAIDTHKYPVQDEQEPRHSALQEFSRDERRPAVLLLGALAIASIFFAIGILVGRWSTGAPPTAAPPNPATQTTTTAPSNPVTNLQQPTPATLPATTGTNQTTQDAERRFTLLIATYNAPEDAQPLIKRLEQAGFTDVRTSTPRPNDSRPRFSVLVGRYTRDDARAAAARLRSTDDPKFKNVRVVEITGDGG
jgi:SPOR domain